MEAMLDEGIIAMERFKEGGWVTGAPRGIGPRVWVTGAPRGLGCRVWVTGAPRGLGSKVWVTGASQAQGHLCAGSGAWPC